VIQAFDLPNDDGSGVYLKWSALPGEAEDTTYTVYLAESPEGPWLEAVAEQPANDVFMEEQGKYFPGFFWFGKNRNGMENSVHVAIVQNVPTGEFDMIGRSIAIPQPPGFTVKPNLGPKNEQGEPIDPETIDPKTDAPKITPKFAEIVPRKIGTMYLKFTAAKEGVTVEAPQVFEVDAVENWFSAGKLNALIFAVLFAATVLFFIARARRDPNLFIRRIAGLNAVDEAIGRATEMGKPILYLNGMDPLASLSTLAALNILGRVARRVANYESSLTVPCRDPIVLTVAQEIVKSGYADAGRPDAYNPDNIFFLTDDQFSYSAAVCGLMLREKPAANFLMGYYYAESLLRYHLRLHAYRRGALRRQRLPFTRAANTGQSQRPGHGQVVHDGGDNPRDDTRHFGHLVYQRPIHATGVNNAVSQEAVSRTAGLRAGHGDVHPGVCAGEDRPAAV
jgi:hypothetical protein